MGYEHVNFQPKMPLGLLWTGNSGDISHSRTPPFVSPIYSTHIIWYSTYKGKDKMQKYMVFMWFSMYLYRNVSLKNERNYSLLTKELSDLTSRTEKKNMALERRKTVEKKKAASGKGKLAQEELDKMVPLTINDMFENKDEIGTITIKTNNKFLNSFQVYSIYKQRQTIEQFFKTYADTMEFEASYMKDNYCEEAWLFLNHLSSILSIRILETISAIGEEKNISYKDFVQTLTKIKSNIVSKTEWRVVPIKKSVQRLCDKLEYIPSDFQNIMSQDN